MRKLPHIILSPTIAHFLMPNKATVLFALKGVIAIGIALSIAMYLALDNPFWAAIPAVMLQARPHSGFVMEKALFLVVSSLIGAVLAFLILSYFIHTPVLAIAILTLIVATVAFLTFSFRHANFVFGLALIPITANMIVLFAISHMESISSQAIFNIAFARVSEVMLGASCAIFASALLFPLRMKDVLSTHTRLLITHLQNYLLLVLDIEKSEEEKEKQLKILLGLIILINDDSSPNLYEHRKNTKRALFMINQSLSLIALTKSLDSTLNVHDLKTLLEQFKNSIKDHQFESHKLQLEVIKAQIQQINNIPQIMTIQAIFEIYENIILAEYENRHHQEFSSQRYSYSKRLKSHLDILSGLVSSFRVVGVYLICILIWAASDGSTSLLMMVILPILFGQMFVHAPNPSLLLIKLGKGALLSIPLVTLILFSLMSGITGYLEIFLLILLPVLFIGLMAMTNPAITPNGLGFCFCILTLVQPSNHMNFLADQSLMMGLAMALSMLITALSFQLIPKVSPVLLQKKIIEDITYKIKSLGKSVGYKHEQFNQDIAEKLLFLSSYQQNTDISRKLFQLGILELTAGHILLNIHQELQKQGLTSLFFSIRNQIYQIFLLIIHNDRDQAAKRLQELEVILEKLPDDKPNKSRIKALVEQLREI